ncbi:peptidoglycan DD-metalloendopeptidase family protein [Paraburkholderia dilworthii]|uniref:peptidoglycan DD-metalloendopeptidase family protein n=1 Tax=Paraburkholderia dilworthii TaxID=948106 RepID=UPI000485C634|nr:peptidoglycan DD-metalloendopeptidase family protein [Paraburkholderia dilworthii]
MKICLPRCAKPAVTILLALWLAAALSGCSLLAPSGSPTNPPPAWPAGNVPAIANEAMVPAGFYWVNAGDTLAGIAREFGRDAAAIAQWNHMSTDGALRAGQLLRVAPQPGAASAPAGSSGRAAATTDPRANPVQGAAAITKARLVWPVNGALAAPFVAGKTRGIAIAPLAGEQVKAAASGRVVYAGGGIAAYGLLIIIKHDAHLLTAYGNNRALLVKEGALVKKGQAVAELSADAHGDAFLHFEVRDGGKPVDPLIYLPKRR